MEVAEKKKLMVPELRFGEFNLEWDSTQLKNVVQKQKGGASFKPSDFVEKSDYEVIPKKAIGPGGNLNLDSDQPTFCSEQTVHNYSKHVVDNNYLITATRDLVPTAPNLGYIVSFDSDIEYLLAQGTCGFLVNEKRIDRRFVIQFSNTQSFRRVMYRMKVGSTQVFIRNPDYFKTEIPLPPLDEQKKIADFLSAVDARIQHLGRKKELLEQYKKGVMQKLFSQELRFKRPDGTNYPDWEEKRLEDVVVDGKGAMKIGPFGSQLKRSTFVEHGFKVYGQENIFIEDFNDGDRYITEDHFKSLKSNEILPGDFVISTMGTIGKCTLVPEGIERGIMDSHMIRLRLNPNAIVAGYLAQIFRSFGIQKQIKRFSVGGIMDGLSMGIIRELKFNIPSKEEQQKIADFLSALDKKIEAVSFQIAKTQQFKKGLLQKMFV